MSTNPPTPSSGQYRVVRREPGYLVLYSTTGKPATVGTRGYETDLQRRVDAIQQGDGIRLSGHGLHEPRTLGRLKSVRIVDRRAIRLVSRNAPIPEPFSTLWADSGGTTTTGGFSNSDGERVADVVLEPESTELVTMFWNGLIDFESQFENREFGGTAPTDVLVVNNESTDYITIIYHAEITKTLQEIYQIYFSAYDPTTDTGDQYKAELLYPEFRQFRDDIPDEAPADAVLTCSKNPFPHIKRIEGPVLDRDPTAINEPPANGSTPAEPAVETPAAPSDSSESAASDAGDPTESDETSEADDTEKATAERSTAVDERRDGDEETEEARPDDQPPWERDLDVEFTQSWQDESGVTMADYGGRPELCETIENSVIVPFRDRPEQARQLGVPVPTILLYGPPGTGKTYLAKALAGEIGYPYVALSGGDVLSRYINASTEQVNDLFGEARALAEYAGGALIFIDEIDSVLKARQSTNQHAEDRKVVNEFLNHIEDIGEQNILFIGATNVHDELDSAALSRFDKELFVDLPNEHTRREIIATHLDGRAHVVTDVEIAELAAATPGLSARDLTNIITDAARRTLVDPEATQITYAACEAALAEFSADD